jgi:putative CocE/NonD family hydrolase
MAIGTRVTTAYMTDDQRFAAWRPDVLVYSTDALEQNMALAGPLVAELWVSTSGTASDWVVKLIDVFPPDAPDYENLPEGLHMGGYQMMVRSEVIRGRFRDSNEHPRPFVPGKPTRVTLPLQDILHTFQSGHRLMVQIQSTWFPFIDRNPQKYVDNIYLADENDFIKATQRVYRSKEHPTRLLFNVLK